MQARDGAISIWNKLHPDCPYACVRTTEAAQADANLQQAADSNLSQAAEQLNSPAISKFEGPQADEQFNSPQTTRGKPEAVSQIPSAALPEAITLIRQLSDLIDMMALDRPLTQKLPAKTSTEHEWQARSMSLRPDRQESIRQAAAVTASVLDELLSSPADLMNEVRSEADNMADVPQYIIMCFAQAGQDRVQLIKILTWNLCRESQQLLCQLLQTRNSLEILLQQRRGEDATAFRYEWLYTADGSEHALQLNICIFSICGCMSMQTRLIRCDPPCQACLGGLLKQSIAPAEARLCRDQATKDLACSISAPCLGLRYLL